LKTASAGAGIPAVENLKVAQNCCTNITSRFGSLEAIGSVYYRTISLWSNSQFRQPPPFIGNLDL
jgi:hypothetical protein